MSKAATHKTSINGKPMKATGLINIVIAALLGKSTGIIALAQTATLTELGGLRVPPSGIGGVDSNATFAIGMTTDNGVSWRSDATPAEAVQIVGKLRPEVTQIGQQADIYLVVKTDAGFLMRKTDGAFTPWSGNTDELVPYKRQSTLTAETGMDLYTGKLGVSGEFQLFLGYRGADGVLRYSPRPFVLTSAANPAASSADWFFNGADWQSNGSPPACANPLLQLPVETAKVTSILYPGQTRGGDYKAHGGFRFDGTGQSNQVNVVAAIAGTVVRGERDNTNGVVQYGFEIINSCGVMMRIGHLLELSPQFAAIANSLPPASASSEFHSVSGHTVTAGAPIATAIGLPGNVFMDFGVYDLRSRNPATTGMTGELKPYGICWLDALPTADATRVRSLPAADGESGKRSDYCR